jgi:hypothetical protein
LLGTCIIVQMRACVRGVRKSPAAGTLCTAHPVQLHGCSCTGWLAVPVHASVHESLASGPEQAQQCISATTSVFAVPATCHASCLVISVWSVAGGTTYPLNSFRRAAPVPPPGHAPACRPSSTR